MVRRSDILRIAAIIAIAIPYVAVARGQNIPRGYEVITIAGEPYSESLPRMNGRGQVVYTGSPAGGRLGAEIFLYDDRSRETIRLTNNNVQDANVDINEDGVICWMSVLGETPNGDPTSAIMVRTPDGVITQLTDGDLTYDRCPRINRHSQIAWIRWDRLGCTEESRNIMFFDGKDIRRITDNEWTNQSMVLNDRGDITWAEFDLCQGGGFNWRSLIKLYSDGVITTLSEPGLQSQATTLNNNRLCAWTFNDPVTFEGGIQTWQNGERTLLTNWGTLPALNDRGDMYLIRWHETEQTWQPWGYLRGEFYRLADDSSWHTAGHINQRGEMTWRTIDQSNGNSDITLMRRFERGDLNCDGVVNSLDIEPFLTALFDAERYLIEQPSCDPLLADLNQDGSVNALDIEPFIHVLFP